MANAYDDEGGSAGSGFVMGLLTGTVLGAGLGMLLAPKSGSELRNQLSDTASSAGRAASEQYRKASEAASHLAGKGRELYGKVKGAAGRGAEEARQYAADAQERASD
jgi:gas vesicle protein